MRKKEKEKEELKNEREADKKLISKGQSGKFGELLKMGKSKGATCKNMLKSREMFKHLKR